MNSNIIPIFFACDNGFVKYTMVSLKSLMMNADRDRQYNIHILNTGIDDDKKQVVLDMADDVFHIYFNDVTEYLKELEKRLPLRDYYSYTTYYRLFIPELYPEYDKAVYIDSDTVCLSDIAELYNTDMGDNLIAGIPDGVIQAIDIFKDYVERVVGVADYNNYFNAGVIVMNLKELRDYKFEEKFIYMLEKIKFEVAQDQDYLNRLCKGRVKILDYSWNRMPVMGKTEEKINLIHYNLGAKPWYFDNVVYQEYFWEYAKKTEFYNEIKELGTKYTDEDKERDDSNSLKLMELAKKETECVGDDRINRR